MNGVRGLGRVAGLALLAGLLLPALAPWPMAMLDRGPDGSVRVSAFPAALVVFDPYLRSCAQNSAIVAGLVAAGSIGLGVGLGHAWATRRFWGRRPLGLLGLVPLAAGPLLVAPGIALALGGSAGWDWLAARSILGWSAEGLVRWAGLTWAGLAWGVPMVALATAAALRRVEPSWSEAARAFGASPFRVWRDAVWPSLRPEVGRSAAVVFTLALIEPAAPLVLGLRRTLAVQMLGAATRLDQPTRAAALAAISIGIAVAGRAILIRWGGTPCLGPGPDPAPPLPRAGRRRAFASMAVMAAWVVVGAGPVAWMLLRAIDPDAGASLGRWPGMLVGWLADPEARAWALNGVVAGLAAVGLDLLIVGAVAGRVSRGAVRALEAVPPLALAVGALALPWLLGALADAAGGGVGDWARLVALELSPARTPGVLLIVAIAAGRLPSLAAADHARGRSLPALGDLARLLGASRSRAFRAGQGRLPRIVPNRPAILAAALGSTALAPALLLAPGSECRTLAPAILESFLVGDPPPFGPIAAILAVNLAGFALASRGRSGPPGGWFRG